MCQQQLAGVGSSSEQAAQARLTSHHLAFSSCGSVAQFFLKFVFRAEEAEYTSECVKYTPVEYQDNEGCIELIEKTPSGILRILDTQCKTPKASDDSFSLQVRQ